MPVATPPSLRMRAETLTHGGDRLGGRVLHGRDAHRDPREELPGYHRLF
jgi:hypothetical protein